MRKSIILFLALLALSCQTQPKTFKTDFAEQWMGVHLQQGKIGYSYSQIYKVKDSYKMVNRVKISLAMMGQAEEVISNFIGITDTGFVLQSFEFSFQSKKRSFSASGAVKGNQLALEIKSGGTTKQETKEIQGVVYPVMALGNLAMKRRFRTGQEYNVKVFDAMVLAVTDAKVKVLGKEQKTISGKSYDLTKVTVSLLGLTSTMWVDENGISRKEVSPPGMTMVEEPREEALSQEAALGKVDILSLFSVPVDTMIPDPRKTKYLKLQITGIDLNGLNLQDNSQTVLQTNPLILEIKSADSLSGIKLPISSAQEYLKSTLWIQSDNAEIKATAKKIIGKDKDGSKIVQKILAWVFTNVNKRATASLPSAVDVLKNLEGDCNEHSVLFAALCRAVGIPTQICVGLVYVDGRFYYHAWNKVFLSKWVAVDPTFGQFPIDATHIKFAEGELEEQAKVLKIVGEVKIKILEFR